MNNKNESSANLMHKKTFLKKVLYIVIGIVLFLLIGGWIFLNFFAEGVINRTVIPKLSAATRIATHGRYVLTLGSIQYSYGTVLCRNFELLRARYDSTEEGMVVGKVVIDTVKLTGVSWWDILRGNDISITSMEMNTPRLYMVDASLQAPSPDVIGDSLKNFPQAPSKMPVLGFDSIVLRDILVFLPSRSQESTIPSFRATVKLSNFLLDQESNKKEPLLFSKRVDFSLPTFSYVTEDSFYSVQIRNLKGSLSDSLLTIDSFSYKPNYSEDVYAAKHPVARAGIDFRLTQITLHGINYKKIFAGKSIELHKLEAETWYLNSYLDRRRPPDIHPDDSPMPNEIIQSLPIKLSIDSLILNKGKAIVRERSRGSLKPGVLFFDRTRLTVAPICSDSLGKYFGKTTEITANAYFVGEGLLRATASYPLMDKNFNIKIHGTVGRFDTKKLNTWLIPFERLEVSEGIVESGNIDINIRSGTATTTVTPVYHDFSLKILATDIKEKRGILEGIKTFWANTFVLKSNNLATDDKPAKSGTASVTRHRDEEFMQFLWISLRKSLGKVVGGFK